MSKGGGISGEAVCPGVSLGALAYRFRSMLDSSFHLSGGDSLASYRP